MQITPTRVPGAGTLHDAVSRSGQRFRILVSDSGRRELYVYPESTDVEWVTIELDADEADQVADLLHSTPIPDRMAELERRLTELARAK